MQGASDLQYLQHALYSEVRVWWNKSIAWTGDDFYHNTTPNTSTYTIDYEVPMNSSYFVKW